MIARVLLMICVWLTLVPAAAQAADASASASASASARTEAQLTASQLHRYHDLTVQLRCLICENRSIAESDAPLAADLRVLVAGQIAAGRSDDQIRRYLVDRYGEWVLYRPPFVAATWLLWLGPFALLLAGLTVVLCLLVRGRQAGSSDVPLDRKRLAATLARDEARSGLEPPGRPTPRPRSETQQ